MVKTQLFVDLRQVASPFSCIEKIRLVDHGEKINVGSHQHGL